MDKYRYYLYPDRIYVFEIDGKQQTVVGQDLISLLQDFHNGNLVFDITKDV